MKLLDNPLLRQISERLSGPTPQSRVLCRIEPYSCKMVGQEKKFYKQISQEGEGEDFELLSPSPNVNSPQLSMGSNGSPAPSCLYHVCPRKVLFFLKSTLNVSFFPDYDFTSAKSHEFTREPSFAWVQRTINSNLMAAQKDEYAELSVKLWSEIMDVMGPAEDVEMYSYNPDMDSDPFGVAGLLWSFNYFFFNKKLKRILFFTCRAVSSTALLEDDEDADAAAEAAAEAAAAADMDEDDFFLPSNDDESASAASYNTGTNRWAAWDAEAGNMEL